MLAGLFLSFRDLLDLYARPPRKEKAKDRTKMSPFHFTSKGSKRSRRKGVEWDLIGWDSLHVDVRGGKQDKAVSGTDS